MNATILISPSLNANGRDRPLGIAAQIDDLPIQSIYFIPEAPTGTLPAAWKGADGFVANSVVSARLSYDSLAPGSHTFKLFMIEPAVIVQKIVIGIVWTLSRSVIALTYPFRLRWSQKQLPRASRE